MNDECRKAPEAMENFLKMFIGKIHNSLEGRLFELFFNEE